MIRLFKKKEIPSKNYIIVIIVTILVVLLMIFIRSFYLNYKSSKLSESIFSSQTVNQIHMDDFDFAIREVPDSILYVSYTGSNEIYSMEKKLYKELENNNLLDKIIYLDCDVVVNNSLKELFETDLENNIIAGVLDARVKHKSKWKNSKYILKNYTWYRGSYSWLY